MGQTREALLPRSLVEGAAGPQVIAVMIRGERRRELGLHSHARGQLFASMSGLLTVSTAAGRWVMPPGRAMWIPPDERHAMQTHGPTEGWSLYVSRERCKDLPSEPRAIQVSALLREAIERAATWTPKTRALTPAEQRIADVLVDEIGAALSAPLHLPMPRTPSLVRVAQTLLRDPTSRRRLEAWAKDAGLAKRTLTRRFRAETGISFGAWRTQLRMLVALEKLAAGGDVATVAFETGYESPSAFIATFRRILGTTPKRYPTRIGR